MCIYWKRGKRTFKSPIVSELGYLFSDSKALSEFVTFSDTKVGLLSTTAMLCQKYQLSTYSSESANIFILRRENTQTCWYGSFRCWDSIKVGAGMRLNCELEVVYALALANGGALSRSSRTRASISLGRNQFPYGRVHVQILNGQRRKNYFSSYQRLKTSQATSTK